MNKIIKSLAMIALVAPQISWAAPRVEEVLSLPVGNRLAVAKGQKETLYPQLKALAFSNDKSMDERWKALSLAAHLSPEEGVSLAKRAIKQDEWYMRNAGLVVLTALKAPEAKSVGLKLLGDRALVVRSAAVETLGTYASADRDVRQALWNELFEARNFRKGQSLWIRKQIVETLMKDLKPLEAPMISRLNNDKDVSIRKLIAKAQLPQ